jgi:hypothetical protein
LMFEKNSAVKRGLLSPDMSEGSTCVGRGEGRRGEERKGEERRGEERRGEERREERRGGR